MKITEIKWESGKKYKSNDTIFTVNCFENELITKNESKLSLMCTSRAITKMDFEEVKQLTKQELDLLNLLDSSFSWIARDRNGKIWAYTNKPEKKENSFVTYDHKLPPVELSQFDLPFESLSFEDKEATKWR